MRENKYKRTENKTEIASVPTMQYRPKGKRGPPQFSINGAKTGANISRLTLGELPNTMRRQLQNARKYRRFLEDLVVDVRGEVNVTDAHLIDEAAKAEIHASVCRHLMRKRQDKMSVSDIARCSEQILKATTARNKAVMQLKLNAPPPDPWSVIDGKLTDRVQEITTVQAPTEGVVDGLSDECEE
jgi:hypothetical protein